MAALKNYKHHKGAGASSFGYPMGGFQSAAAKPGFGNIPPMPIMPLNMPTGSMMIPPPSILGLGMNLTPFN
jgi:hypothetical protein